MTLLQPLQALEHPSFKEMIDIATQATNGVNIPNRKAVREEILHTFKTRLESLKQHLNVSSAFSRFTLI
jgi:hypothetical protein